VFKYEVKATTNALTETGTSSEDNGTFLNAQSVAVTLPKLAADLQAQVQLICAGRPYVFVEDYNGNILLLGATNGTMSSCTKVTGGAGGDLTGFTLAITAEEGNLSPFLDATTKTALFALVSDVVVS
jgi:predicted Rossmann-fold nucleotide-binding protein